MANEIEFPFGVTGSTNLYAVQKTAAGLVCVSANLYEAVSEAHWAAGQYRIVLTEDGSTGVYRGSLKTTLPGTHYIEAYARAGVSDAITDPQVGEGTVVIGSTLATNTIPVSVTPIKERSKESDNGIGSVLKRFYRIGVGGTLATSGLSKGSALPENSAYTIIDSYIDTDSKTNDGPGLLVQVTAFKPTAAF